MKKKTVSTTLQEPVHQVYKSTVQLMIDNVMGGIAWGVGSVIGATIVVTVIGFVLTRLQTVPFVGSIILSVVREVNTFQSPPPQ